MKVKLVFFAMLVAIPLVSQEFKKPQKPDVSQYKTACKRMISTKANYGLFIERVAEVLEKTEKSKEKNGIVYTPQIFSIDSFSRAKFDIERWNEDVGSDSSKRYEKNAQYYINRLEHFLTVFDIKVVFSGIEISSDYRMCTCNYEVTFKPKQELDIGNIAFNGKKINNARSEIPSVMELSDKDFNILSNLLGRSLAEERFLDNEIVSVLLFKYYEREFSNDFYRFLYKPRGTLVELSVGIDTIEEVMKNPTLFDLPM